MALSSERSALLLVNALHQDEKVHRHSLFTVMMLGTRLYEILMRLSDIMGALLTPCALTVVARKARANAA